MNRRHLLQIGSGIGVISLGGCLGNSEWERSSENPIIEGRAETQQQAGFGGIIYAPTHFQRPIDEWYFYWAGHDKGGVWLSTAPTPKGPWTTYGNVFDISDLGEQYGHVSSPYPVAHHSGEILLYYHKAHYINGGSTWVQDTHYATIEPQTGAAVEMHHGEALSSPADGSWNEEERSYLKVSQCDEGYVGVYQGCDHECRTPKLGLARSNNGREWTLKNQPLFASSSLYDADRSQFVGTPHLEVVDEHPRVLFQWIPESQGKPSGIYRLPLSEHDAEQVTPEFIFGAEQNWTKGQSLHVVDDIVHEGTKYLFYSDSAGDNQQHIGVATKSTKRIF